MSIYMRPDEVDKAGHDLEALTEGATGRTRALLASSETAAQGHPQWLSSPALAACRQAYLNGLHGLITRTKQIGVDLKIAAGNATAADREAADRLGDALGNMAGQ